MTLLIVMNGTAMDVKSVFALLSQKVTKAKASSSEKGDDSIEKRTVSGVIGKGDLAHNNRTFIAENVDRQRIKNNITVIREPVADVYHELFDKALGEYNSKQNRKDRIIKDYHDHIRHSRQEKEFHEVIFQIGNKDDTAVGTDMAETAALILRKYAEEFQERNPHLRLFNAVIHLDEATPHLHLDFVPFATGQRRGLSTRVSLSKALEQQGFSSKGKFETCSKLWIDNEKKRLSELMLEHGIEWEQLGTEREHLSVLDYKKQERTKEIAALDKEISKAADKAVKLNAVDNIAAKKSLIGDKITVSREDYENLTDLAKKQIAAEKKEKKLKSENAALQNKISEQNAVINTLKSEISDSKSVSLRIENQKLKERISALEKFKSSVESFLDRCGMLEKFMNFFRSAERQTQMQTSREQEMK